MPVFKVQAPDGSIIKVEAADEATAIRGAQEHHASSQSAAPAAKPKPKAAPILDPVNDVLRAVRPAIDNLKADYQRVTKTGKGDALGSLIGLPLAALQGLTTNQITGPTSRALAASPLPIYDGDPLAYLRDGPKKLEGAARQQAFESMLNTALMAAKPGPAFKAPVAAIRAAPEAARVAAKAGPEVKAVQYVEKLSKAAGKTPKDLAAVARPVTSAEAMGKTGQAGLGALARRPGATGDALTADIAERQMTRPSRMLDDFAGASGIPPEAAAGDLQAMVDAGRVKAAPLYEQAYADPAPQSDLLDKLLTRPSMKGAMNRAVRIAAEEGRDPTALGFDLDVEGNVVRIRTPSMQTMDYVKRGLDDVLNARRDTTTGRLNLDEEGRAVLRTLNEFRAEVAKPGSNYRAALDASGDYLSAENAFKDGGKFIFNSQLNERQFADRLAKMSESDLNAFRGGIANKFYDLAQTGKLDPKVLKTPRVRAKLEMAMGKEQAGRLIDLAGHEGDMLSFERRYGPAANSITAEMTDAMKVQDQQSAGGEFGSDVLGAIHQGPRQAIASAIGKMVQRSVDAARTPGMSTEVRDEAGRLLMLPPPELATLLEQLAAVAKPPGPLDALRGVQPLLPTAAGLIGQTRTDRPAASTSRR